MYAETAHGWRPLVSWQSQLTSQSKHGIEAYRVANGGGAAGKGDDHRDRQDHGEEHRRNCNLGIENGAANLVRQQSAGGETYKASDQGEQRSFGEEDRCDREPSRA